MSEYIVELTEENHIRLMAECDGIHEDVVRCRDCRWFTPEYEYQEEYEYGVFETLIEPPDCGNPERCSHHYDGASKKMVPVHIVTRPDGFCAWGERRSE